MDRAPVANAQARETNDIHTPLAHSLVSMEKERIEEDAVTASLRAFESAFLDDDALLSVLLHCDAVTLVRCGRVCHRLLNRITQLPTLVHRIDLIRPYTLRLVPEEEGSERRKSRLARLQGHTEDWKQVVVGEASVGKTCLAMKLTTEEYIPTVFDNYTTNYKKDRSNYKVSFWDTAGQEDYDRLRPLSYPGTDIFLICFELNNRISFNKLSTRWLLETGHHCPDAMWVLVGLKRDARADEARRDTCISNDEAYAFAQAHGAVAYLEVSSLTNDGTDSWKELFFHCVDPAPLEDTIATRRFSIPKSKPAGGVREPPEKPVANPVQPQPAAPPPQVHEEDALKKYADEYGQLLEMGFTDEDAIRRALRRADGNVQHACAILFSD